MSKKFRVIVTDYSKNLKTWHKISGIYILEFFTLSKFDILNIFLSSLSAARSYLISVWDVDRRKKRQKSLFRKSAVKDAQKKEVMQEDCVLLARYLKGKFVLYLSIKLLKIHHEKSVIHNNYRLHYFFI